MVLQFQIKISIKNTIIAKSLWINRPFNKKIDGCLHIPLCICTSAVFSANTVKLDERRVKRIKSANTFQGATAHNQHITNSN